MQVDPIKPILKAPETKRLKLKSDGPPSKFAFKINLRRYSVEMRVRAGDAAKFAMALSEVMEGSVSSADGGGSGGEQQQPRAHNPGSAANRSMVFINNQAGAYIRPLSSST